MSDEDFRLDNPMLVRWEFASEERLEKRNPDLPAADRGRQRRGVPLQVDRGGSTVARARGRCGAGTMAQRVRDELGTEVVAVDSSERMVELTRQRGIERMSPT